MVATQLTSRNLNEIYSKWPLHVNICWRQPTGYKKEKTEEYVITHYTSCKAHKKRNKMTKPFGLLTYTYFTNELLQPFF